MRCCPDHRLQAMNTIAERHVHRADVSQIHRRIERPDEAIGMS
jgi:hypothetical protein